MSIYKMSTDFVTIFKKLCNDIKSGRRVITHTDMNDSYVYGYFIYIVGVDTVKLKVLASLYLFMLRYIKPHELLDAKGSYKLDELIHTFFSSSDKVDIKNYTIIHDSLKVDPYISGCKICRDKHHFDDFIKRITVSKEFDVHRSVGLYNEQGTRGVWMGTHWYHDNS